jgi:hypothetical protein
MMLGGSFEALLALCDQRVTINRLETYSPERGSTHKWVVSFAPYGTAETWKQESHIRLGEALNRAVSTAQLLVVSGYADTAGGGG